jgi:hypothetical protein
MTKDFFGSLFIMFVFYEDRRLVIKIRLLALQLKDELEESVDKIINNIYRDRR